MFYKTSLLNVGLAWRELRPRSAFWPLNTTGCDEEIRSDVLMRAIPCFISRCEEVRPGIGPVGGCANHLDHHISTLPFSMGGSRGLSLIHHPSGHSVKHTHNRSIINLLLLANVDTMGSVLSYTEYVLDEYCRIFNWKIITQLRNSFQLLSILSNQCFSVFFCTCLIPVNKC